MARFPFPALASREWPRGGGLSGVSMCTRPRLPDATQRRSVVTDRLILSLGLTLNPSQRNSEPVVRSDAARPRNDLHSTSFNGWECWKTTVSEGKSEGKRLQTRLFLGVNRLRKMT